MTLTSLDRVIINRMAIVNKHDYDGFDEVHTHNINLRIAELKKEKKIQQVFFSNLLYFTI